MTTTCLCEVIFNIEYFVEIYHKYNTSSSNDSSISTTTAIPLPTNKSTTAVEMNYGVLVTVEVLAILFNLCILWSIWQVVKDLQKRNQRIAKAKLESREAEFSATTFTDEKDTGFHNEKGQQPSIVWI